MFHGIKCDSVFGFGQHRNTVYSHDFPLGEIHAFIVIQQLGLLSCFTKVCCFSHHFPWGHPGNVFILKQPAILTLYTLLCTLGQHDPRARFHKHRVASPVCVDKSRATNIHSFGGTSGITTMSSSPIPSLATPFGLRRADGAGNIVLDMT